MARINDVYDVGAAFEAIENELISSMIRNMKRHKVDEVNESRQWAMWQSEMLHSLERYRRDNQKKFGKQFQAINSKITALIQAAKAEGGMAQEAKILDAIRKGFPASKTLRGGTAEFFKINDRKLNALIQATQNDMQSAELAVLRMANDQYRKVIFNAQMYANSSAGTYEKAVDMATKDFLSAGLNCIAYANGARHTLADYADMAIRTASKRAYLQGEGEKRQEWGLHLVIMNKRGNPCPKCLPFVGKIMIDDVWSGGSRRDGNYPLMSTAIAAGLYHPRCRDSHTTYFPGITTVDPKYNRQELADIEDTAKQEARQQYAQRQEKRFGRLADFSLDPENQQRYEQKQKEWEDQAYRPVTRGESSTIFIRPEQEINIKRVETYSEEVYVSDKAEIKPRVLHTINQRTDQALKEWKISLERKPKIVIVSPDEMPTAYGKYDAIQNTVFYIPQIADDKIIKEQGNIEFHEMWHMRQAENFRNKKGKITKENYTEYLKSSCKTAKKAIDRAGITKYNVGEISDYAKKMYNRTRYDEVEAEYMAMNRKKA